MSRYRMVCALGLMVIPALACRRAEPNANLQPILEWSASRPIHQEVERAATELEAALLAADSCSEDTRLLLRAADKSLRHLLDYFIPLIQARESSIKAALYFNIQQIDRAEDELNRAEDRLQAVAQVNHGELFHEVEPPLEMLEDARTAIRADPLEAPDLLLELSTRINNMIVKGGLIVD
jgi:hypothetical protein